MFGFYYIGELIGTNTEAIIIRGMLDNITVSNSQLYLEQIFYLIFTMFIMIPLNKEPLCLCRNVSLVLDL